MLRILVGSNGEQITMLTEHNYLAILFASMEGNFQEYTPYPIDSYLELLYWHGYIEVNPEVEV